ncbi:DUF2892 domain-containing protein [Leptospira sp. 96542]|nr:DUF2892 domain-containing protein [Leptospira sp. 96542]
MYLASTKNWYLERAVFLIAGVFSLVGLSVGFFLSEYGFILNLLVGFNLILFSFTGFCPMAIILHKLGLKSKSEVTQ